MSSSMSVKPSASVGRLRISLIAVLAAHQSLYVVPSSAVPPLVDRMS